MNKDFIISEIAKLYYMDGIKQSEIAKVFDISPMQVSRILKTAIDKKVVKFSVQMPIYMDMDLGRKIAVKYNLLECIVLENEIKSSGHTQNRVAQYMAKYVDAILKNGDIIGVSWGKGISEFVESFSNSDLKNIRIVQLAGGVASDDKYMYTSSHIITRLCACFRESIPVYLNAPFFASDLYTKNKILEDASIQRNHEFVQKAKVNIMGCSSLNENATVRQMGIISSSDMEELQQKGAIGEIGSYFIDAEGNLVQWSKSDLYSGASISLIKEARFRICLASDDEKRSVLRAVLPKGIVNVLIITQSLAKYLI